VYLDIKITEDSAGPTFPSSCEVGKMDADGT
jgi:hypothetical protein